MTTPLLNDQPTQAEREEDTRFASDLYENGIFGGYPKEQWATIEAKRKQVLELLNKLAILFVHAEARGQDFTESGLWAEVRLYGSGALGATLPDGDMDTYVDRLPV